MNIHILPTYKASRLQKTKYGNLFLVNKFKSYDNCTPQHIYITSDEEIKPNDWYENNGVIFKADTPFDEGNNPNNSNPRVTDFNKKIILTTDPQLIEDGIQAIDDTFLEWFIKNPSCERVEVSIMNKGYNKTEDIPYQEFYKIIIPKEEPKQENCCTPIGQIKRYMNCVGCDRNPQQETLEQSYQRGYERGLNALIPLIENLNKEITELKRKGI
jgi:hypothetical protein